MTQTNGHAAAASREPVTTTALQTLSELAAVLEGVGGAAVLWLDAPGGIYSWRIGGASAKTDTPAPAKGPTPEPSKGPAPEPSPTPKPSPECSRCLSPKQVATLLDISPRSVWRWLKDGRLPQPMHWTRRTVRWRASDIEDFLRTRKQRP